MPKAGPKKAADPTPLPVGNFATESERFAAFCEQYVKVPKGTGARDPLKLRPWQQELAASVLDNGYIRSAAWMMPRGQGKSTLVAALALYDLLCGQEGASIVCVATDERQARIVWQTAVRMTELDDELGNRVETLKDHVRVPARGAHLQVLPAEPKHLEGLDPSLAILDEIGVINRDVYETVVLASGKRERSLLLGIGTPAPNPHEGVLADLRAYAAEHPEDQSFVYREHSAAGFEDHPVDCEHCWESANPALGDYLHRDALTALLPPKTREATFRRARLCQLVTDTSGEFLPVGCWDGLDTGEHIATGADVVLALDGSFSDDTTALLLATVSTEPHFDTLKVWEKPEGDDSWRVPVQEVEDTIRQACRDYSVLEIIADPFRWTRTLQVLESEKLPVVEFPHSPSRLTAATTDLYSAAVNGKMSHSGDPKLAAHVDAAVIKNDGRGFRLDKQSQSRHARKIDLAACLVMGHSRATWRATKKRRKRAASFAA